MKKPPSISIVIPTYNRPRELATATASILKQTVLPKEVIILDDGNTLDGIPYEKEMISKGIKPIFYQNREGVDLTKKRNLGASMASGEIIAYLDDDVELFPDYIERILEVYARDPDGKIGGVGGFVVNPKPMTWTRKLRFGINFLFLMDGFVEGKVLPSGFCTDLYATPFPIKKIQKVDFLMGASCSFRREVFDKLQFTPGYHNYALDEDKDFSHRVARRWTVVITPHARLMHFESPKMRPDKTNYAFRHMAGRYLFFTAYVKRHPLQWLFFWWAVFGYFVTWSAYMLITGDRTVRTRLKGVWRATLAILRREPLRVPYINRKQR